MSISTILDEMDNLDAFAAIELGNDTLDLPGIGEPEKNKIRATIRQIERAYPQEYDMNDDPMMHQQLEYMSLSRC